MKSVSTFLIGLLVALPAAAQQKAAESAPDEASAPAATPEHASAPNLAEELLHLDLSTGGRVTIRMRPDAAPNHVERIKTLTRRGFYNGIVFHRVIEGFMAQTGDPTGTGSGGSDLPDLKAEFSRLPHMRGTASMARTDDPDSANSQFFIMFMPGNAAMDGKYTVWGRVISGMQFVDRIERGEPPATPSRIIRASLGPASATAPVASQTGISAGATAGPAEPAAPTEPATVAAAADGGQR